MRAGASLTDLTVSFDRLLGSTGIDLAAHRGGAAGSVRIDGTRAMSTVSTRRAIRLLSGTAVPRDVDVETEHAGRGTGYGLEDQANGLLRMQGGSALISHSGSGAGVPWT